MSSKSGSSKKGPGRGKTSGGRVTPKGTQPPEKASSRSSATSRLPEGSSRPVPYQSTAHGRDVSGAGPTRRASRRGNR